MKFSIRAILLLLCVGMLLCAPSLAEQDNEETHITFEEPTKPTVRDTAADTVTPLEDILDGEGNLPGYVLTTLKDAPDAFVIAPAEGQSVAKKQLKKLNDLIVYAEEPIDVSFLAACPNVKTLRITCGARDGFAVIGGLEALKSFTYEGNVSADVACLAACRKLKELFLVGAPMTGLKALEALTGMRKLVFKAQEASAVNALLQSQVKTLKELNLADLVGVDLSPLSEAKNLERLTVRGLKGEGMTKLSRPPKLQALYLYDSDLSCVADWKDLPTLKTVVLAEMGEVDGGAIAQIGKNAKAMRITDSVIVHRELLSGLKKLNSLTIERCGLTELSFLSGLPKIEKLYLNDNLITDIAPLADLTDLTECNLRNNQLQDITPLAKCKKLKKLELRDNPELRSVKALSACKKLELLILPANVNDCGDLPFSPRTTAILQQKTEQEKAAEAATEAMRTEAAAAAETMRTEAETARPAAIVQALQAGEMADVDKLVDAEGNLTNVAQDIRGAIAYRLGLSENDPIPVSRLSELEELSVGSTDGTVLDLSFLQLCPDLTTFACSTPMQSAAPLFTLFQLDCLAMDYTGRDESLTLLPCLPKLTTLELSNYNGADTSWLALCPNLNSVRLMNCPNIKDIDAISQNEYVWEIELVDVPVERLPIGEGLFQLGRIHLEHTQISDISFLQNCPELRSVFIMDKVYSILPLCGSRTLESLFLTGPDVDELDAVLTSSAASLKELTLNSVTPDDNLVATLAKAANLRKLIVQNCGLSDIAPLAALKNCEWIDISYNESIQSVASLAGCKALKYLFLNQNVNVGDLDELKAALPGLEVIREARARNYDYTLALPQEELARRQNDALFQQRQKERAQAEAALKQEQEVTPLQQEQEAQGQDNALLRQAIEEQVVTPLDDLLDADGNVILTDPALEQVLREALHVEKGVPISAGRLAEITEFVLCNSDRGLDQRADISLLQGMPDLTYFGVWNCYICRSVAPVVCCPRLSAAYVNLTGGASLEPFRYCPDLRSLSLDTNGELDLSPLAGCANLSQVNCGDGLYTGAESLYDRVEFSYQNMYDFDPKHIEQNLRELAPRLTFVMLSDVPITADLIKLLQTAPRLNGLRFQGNCRVNEPEKVLAAFDEGFSALTSLELSLSGERPAWVDQLKEKHPTW